MPLIFGSFEADAVVEADRRKYGDSRLPPEPGAPREMHRYCIVAECSVKQRRTYFIKAFSAKQARDLWEHDAGDYDDAEELYVTDWEHDVEVEDLGPTPEGEEWSPGVPRVRRLGLGEGAARAS